MANNEKTFHHRPFFFFDTGFKQLHRVKIFLKENF